MPTPARSAIIARGAPWNPCTAMSARAARTISSRLPGFSIGYNSFSGDMLEAGATLRVTQLRKCYFESFHCLLKLPRLGTVLSEAEIFRFFLLNQPRYKRCVCDIERTNEF